MRRRGVLACTRRYTLTPLCHQPSRALRPPTASTKIPLREPRLPPSSTGPLLPAVRLADTPRRASQLQLPGPCGSLQPTKAPLGSLVRRLGSSGLATSPASRRYRSHLLASRRFRQSPLAGIPASTTFHQPLHGVGLLPLAENPSSPPLAEPSFRSRPFRRLDRRPTYLLGAPTCTLGRLPAFRSPRPVAFRPLIAWGHTEINGAEPQ